MKHITVFLSIFGFVLIPYMVHAGPILRSGETISIDASQSLRGDFYGLAQKVTVSGQAENDVYVGGMSVTINAPVKEDLSVIGGSVQVLGDVGDDVRILGGEVTIVGKVEGDVVVYAASLHILSTANIAGDLIYAGESLLVDGGVVGSIHGFSKKIRINAHVGGDVEYTALESFALGENANIAGSVFFESKNELMRSPSAFVGGDVSGTNVLQESQSNVFESLAFMFLILAFASLSLYFLGKKYVQPFATSTTQSFGQNGLVGLAMLTLIPFVSFILSVSVVGIFVGIILLLMYFAALIASVVLAVIVIGYSAQKLITKKTAITLQTLLLGAITYSLILFVPVVGPLVVFAVTMIVLGNLGKQIYRVTRP